jgi:hypothetical protein
VNYAKTRGNAHKCASEIATLRPILESNRIVPVCLIEEEYIESTIKTTYSRPTKYQPSSTSVECWIMKISTRPIEFPMTKMQECVKALSHIDLVLS